MRAPTKWHRAHVTWFFEQFLLVPHDPAYKIFDERFPFLFNSYYVAAGPRHARPQRGLITRPNAEDVTGYRAHVDAAVERLIERVPAADAARVFEILEIGLHHEQQHQELLITDILHAFAQNPTDPVYDAKLAHAGRDANSSKHWSARLCRCAVRAFMRSDMTAKVFVSTTRRRCMTSSFRMCASRAISSTNAEWLEFIEAGGYTTPSLWLSDGWAAVQSRRLAGARLLATPRRPKGRPLAFR